MAMAGLLTALKETDLWHRLKTEDRLLVESSGNNTDMTLNFVPEMPREELIGEYRRVISTLYDPTLKNYFARCLKLLEYMPKTRHNVRSINMTEFRAFMRSIQKQLFSRQGLEYARFLLKVLKEFRPMFPEAVRLAIMGYHLEKITRHTVAVEDFRNFLAHEVETFKEKVSQFTQVQGDHMNELQSYSQQLYSRVKTEYNTIHEDFRYAAHASLTGFQQSMFKEYLEAELRAFKDAAGAFAKAQSARLGELQTYVHSLFARVRAQHAQLYDSFKYHTDDLSRHTQEAFDAFRESVARHLEQLFGSVPVQIEGLS
jgi:hypothetical protein